MVTYRKLKKIGRLGGGGGGRLETENRYRI